MNTVDLRYNKLLLKQIQKKFGSEDLPIEMTELLNTISQTYDYYERERQLLERSMDLSSEEMIETNQKLEKQAEKLKRSNEELKQFAYAVSHDLKEPLRTIAGYIQLIELRLKGNLTPETKEFMGFAVGGVKRLQSMLEGMLKYAQVGEGQKDFEKLDLNEVLTIAINNLHQSIKTEKVAIKADALPLVSGNRIQLVSVFQNILSNAIKFRSEETPVIEINVTPQSHGFLFSITDNGIGVQGAQKHHLFSMFKRAHNEYDGVGMGLTICKKIIENHGGAIWMDENTGHGMKISFTLPSP